LQPKYANKTPNNAQKNGVNRIQPVVLTGIFAIRPAAGAGQRFSKVGKPAKET